MKNVIGMKNRILALKKKKKRKNAHCGMLGQCKNIAFFVIGNVLFQIGMQYVFFCYLHQNPCTRWETEGKILLWWIQSSLLKNLNLYFPNTACIFSGINKPSWIEFSVTALCVWLLRAGMEEQNQTEFRLQNNLKSSLCHFSEWHYYNILHG